DVSTPHIISTIFAVIVCIDFVTPLVKFLVLSLTIVTIIVLPMAREIANTIETIIPDKAAGITTRKVVSNFVAPNANAHSRIAFGTAFIASSDIDATIGIIITPITIPGLSIFVGSRLGMISLKSGVTNVKAKKP